MEFASGKYFKVVIFLDRIKSLWGKFEMVKIIMFPYAGWGGYAYQKIISYFDKSKYMIYMIDLNGRGERVDYDSYTTWDQLIDGVCQQVIEIISVDSDDYILFGHSMGAKIAYDVYLKLKEKEYKSPLYIVFSGCKTHDQVNEYNKLLKIPQKNFEQEYISLGGIPKEILQDDDFKDYIFEVIKEDLRLLIQYKPKSKKIVDRIIVLNGINDENSSVSDWKHLCSRITYKIYPGNHFFIFQYPQEVVSDICNIVEN